MSTDDRDDGDVLPFPHVKLPGSFDAGDVPLSGADDDPPGGDPPEGPPVGDWPLIPHVADMAPPMHLTMPGLDDEDDGYEDDEAEGWLPSPEDPEQPRLRDGAMMGMAVLAAVGVAAAHGVWHMTRGVRAHADHRRAIADQARAAADKTLAKGQRIQPSPAFGQNAKAGRPGSGSGGPPGRPGGPGGGGRTPATFRSPQKGPERPPGGRSGAGGSGGPGAGGKSGSGPNKGAGAAGKAQAGRDKPGSADRGRNGKSADGKTSSARDSKSSRTSDSKNAKDDKKTGAAGKTAPGKPPKLLSPYKDRPDFKKPGDAPKSAGKNAPSSGPKKPDADSGTGKKPPEAKTGKGGPGTGPRPLFDPDKHGPTGPFKKPGDKPGDKSGKGGPKNTGWGWKEAAAGAAGAAAGAGAEWAFGRRHKDGGGATGGGSSSTGSSASGGFAGPPPPGFEGMAPPPGATEPYKVWLERETPPKPEAPERAAITRGQAALPAGPQAATEPAPTAAGAGAVPAQRGARFVSTPVVRTPSTQYGDAELTIYDVIDADADMAEEITEGVDEAHAAAEGCERLITKLEALHAKVVEMRVPGSLEGMVIRLMEKTALVKAKADAIAQALPRASESIGTAGANAESRHRHLADVTRDMGHTRPAERDYHNE